MIRSVRAPSHTDFLTRLTLALPWVLLVWSLAILVFLQPYSAGYGPFRRTLAATVFERWLDPTWQHGALALPAALFLIWRRRAELAALPIRPCPPAVFAVVAALFLYFVGYRANNYYFGAAGIHLLIGGGLLWMFGWERFKLLAFPWVMLAFAWPVIFLEDSLLLLNLRIFMVNCTSAVLNLIGIATVTDGTTLVSAADPGAGRALGELFRFNVDGPCSGLRSLFALMMVGSLFAYFRQKVPWRRLAVFAASLPLAVLANMARIFVLLGGTLLFGQDFAVGNERMEMSTFHLLAGIAVFVVALAGLQAVSMLLNRLFDRRPGARTVRTQKSAPAGDPHTAAAIGMLKQTKLP